MAPSFSEQLQAHTLTKPQALLFDLDGTLMDTAPDFFPTVNTLRKEHGLPPLVDDLIRLQVSNGGRALTRLALDMPQVVGNIVGNEEFERKRQRLLDLYVENIASNSDLFSGMLELLETCKEKSLPWGIVTNKPRLYTEILLERLTDRLPILAQCAVVVCPDDVERTKPFPDPLYLAADKLKVSAKDCWYLGDHSRDIEAGNAASMLTIATLYGYIEPHDKPEDWKADIMVNTVEEIIDLITASR
ncbi:MAG: HAD-IA family hydrolase [Oleispira sp.]|nr:HAD-IA family hydrolase [Oleispira sp.]